MECSTGVARAPDLRARSDRRAEPGGRKEYRVKAGDGMLIHGGADHYTLNNQTSGNIRRIEVNPIAASHGTAGAGGTKGSGAAPVIRNYSELDMKAGHTLLSPDDGA